MVLRLPLACFALEKEKNEKIERLPTSEGRIWIQGVRDFA